MKAYFYGRKKIRTFLRPNIFLMQHYLFLSTWNTFLCYINFFVDMRCSFVQHEHVFVETILLFVQRQTFYSNTKLFFVQNQIFVLDIKLCYGDILLLSHSNKNIITCQKINKLSFLCDTKKFLFLCITIFLYSVFTLHIVRMLISFVVEVNF